MAAKLYYFDSKGIAEPIRLILSYAGVEFEDIRFPMEGPGENFRPSIPQDIKAKCPWGQVPLLEYEGKVYSQSIATARYLAKKFDLVGSNEYDAFKCDEIVDALRDIMEVWFAIFMEKDSPKAEDLKDEAIKKTDLFLARLSKIVQNNGGQHFVGNSITWAEIAVTHYMKNFEHVFDFQCLQKYPEMVTVTENVWNHPRIKEWIAKRPITKY